MYAILLYITSTTFDIYTYMQITKSRQGEVNQSHVMANMHSGRSGLQRHRSGLLREKKKVAVACNIGTLSASSIMHLACRGSRPASVTTRLSGFAIVNKNSIVAAACNIGVLPVCIVCTPTTGRPWDLRNHMYNLQQWHPVNVFFLKLWQEPCHIY